MAARTRSLPAAPREPRELKRKPSACSSLGSLAGSQPASVPQKARPPQLPGPPRTASDCTYLYFCLSVSVCLSLPTGLSSSTADSPTWTSAQAHASLPDTCPERRGKDKPAHLSQRPQSPSSTGSRIRPLIRSLGCVLPLVVSPTFPSASAPFQALTSRSDGREQEGEIPSLDRCVPFPMLGHGKPASVPPHPLHSKEEAKHQLGEANCCCQICHLAPQGTRCSQTPSSSAAPGPATPSSLPDWSPGVPNQEGEVRSKRGREA